LTDEDNEADYLSPFASDSAYDSQSIAMKTGSDGTKSFQQQTGGQVYYHMPANNKALLANGYVRFHGKNDESPIKEVTLTDSTETIKVMLKARGYDDVERPEGVREDGVTIPILPVAVFQTLTDYGVILIETHGGSRDLFYPKEFLPPELQKLPNCGGENSGYQLVTTDIFAKPPEDAKAEVKAEFEQNIECGRLASHEWWIRNKQGKKVRKVGQLFAVTPNYIRQYNPGKFPDNTLMVLDVCSADKSEAGSRSPMKALLFEKSNKGARFLGWNGNTEVAMMEGASLNLFQLMTASNEKLTVKGITFLKQSTPPQGGWFTPLTQAFEQLRTHDPSLLKDPATKKKKETELQLTSQDGEDSDLILMPHVLQLKQYESDQSWEIFLKCDSQPTATVGETEVSLENANVNAWKLSMPVGAYGDIVVHENGRTSIPRKLHRWRPQIKIDTTTNNGYPPFMHINATVTLLARATMETLSFRDSAWNDPPPAVFDAGWDLEGSNVAWKIDGSGTETYDDTSITYQYNGSGLESFKALEAKSYSNGGTLYTFNGSTIAFQVCVGGLSYTMTQKISDGSSSQGVYDTGFCATIWDNNIIALSDDWTVAGGSYQDLLWPHPIQINWNTFSAEPPFDPENEPR
jgi:hypothetical protein